MRLAKYLAQAGVASRRAAESLIEQGRVAMDIADRSQLQHQDVLKRYFGSAA